MNLKPWIQALESSKSSRGLVLPGLIEQLASAHGDRPALMGETETLTYRDLARRSHRYAQLAIREHVAGHCVALLMHNCPDYVAVWLGLTRVGCTVALLNTNLRLGSLVHCMKAAGAQYLIAPGSDLAAAVVKETCTELLPPLSDLEDDGDVLLADWPLPEPQDIALYVYTSGTTGLPKAAKITHRRATEWSFWFAGMTAATPDDRLYNCLPMYHSIGGVVAIGSMLVAGGSVVVRRRFSASEFWPEVVQSGCTIFQYIGELCRYLTSAPHRSAERQHTLRLAVGNGLQADVWQTFRDRFAIPQILEYYASTEGVLSLYNCAGKPGAIGQVPPVLAPFFAVRLIAVDHETGQPVHDQTGFCIVTACGTPGEAITQMRSDRSFDGYSDAEASDRKILRDVFVKGDTWYRTGDLMCRDAAGFYYFVDRLGDTFRWKGENVSTTEVANVLRACPGVMDAVVYGIEVAGTEGKAGMTAITTAAEFSLASLAEHIDQQLPSYARPLFVRLCQSLDVTVTFKQTKSRLLAEGFVHSSDPVYTRTGTGFVRWHKQGAPQLSSQPQMI